MEVQPPPVPEKLSTRRVPVIVGLIVGLTLLLVVAMLVQRYRSSLPAVVTPDQSEVFDSAMIGDALQDVADPETQSQVQSSEIFQALR